MQNITSRAELKNAIQLLEAEQAIKGQVLKEQFLLTFESLKPANLVKNTLSDLVSSPFLIDNLLNIAISLATGFLTKKIIVSASGSIFRKFLGSIMQVGVTNAVVQHPDAVKSLGQFIVQHIFRKKEGRAVTEDASQKTEAGRQKSED
jgi:hypothetical protein